MIKIISICLLSLLPILTRSQVLEEYKKTNRLLLIFSSSIRDQIYEKQLSQLTTDPLGIDQRDLLIIEIFLNGGLKPDGTSIEETEILDLRSKFNIKNDDFSVVLLDRDGREITRFSEPVSSSHLFEWIDSKNPEIREE